MGTRNRSDRDIAQVAEAQHGVVCRGQLLGCGVTSKEIGGRVRRGLLISLHRGVYALGHRRLAREGRWMAAVLAAGPGALLSHRDAAALHGLLASRNRGRVEVTTSSDVRSTDRLRVFSRRVLTDADRTTVAAIPVTTVERTLVDLGDLLDHDRLLSALAEAERLRCADGRALEAALARVRHRRGPAHGRMRAALAEHRARGLQLTRSQLEIALRRLVREHGLPPAQLNARVGGEEVDAWWPAQRVAVEADGWEFHRGRAAFAAPPLPDECGSVSLGGIRIRSDAR